jgi:uncharacterized protein YbaP (TraB family)
MLKKRLSALLLALAAFLPATASAGETANPALWKVSDEDTSIYLFGTVHALPKDLSWRGKKLDHAFRSADTLVVEVAEDRNKDQKSLESMMRLGMSTPGGMPPLMERVAEKDRPALQSLMSRSSLPPALLDRLETWLAALFLVGPTLNDAGLDPETGADRTLMAEARARRLPVIGLETMDQQLGYFDSLPEDDQRSLLASIIEDDGTAKSQFDALVAAWKQGDIDALEHLADDELKASPHVRQALLTDRNARWAEWIGKRLDEPGTVFVAVGAGHLAGEDSVQHMLAARGLKVERLQ